MHVVDPDRLGALLKVLGNPVRLELLQLLRTPRTIKELRVRPRRREGGKVVERSMAEAAVRRHLNRLVEIGVVRGIKEVVDGRPVERYLVNHQQLFALTEEIAQLARIAPDSRTGVRSTRSEPLYAEPGRMVAPCLVLVKGLQEEQVFRLSDGGGPWTIGRRRGADVWLDYDPYLSSRNTMVARHGDGFVVSDIDGSRNGTWLNGQRLDEVPVPFTHGDLLRVGRSILVFHQMDPMIPSRSFRKADAEG